MITSTVAILFAVGYLLATVWLCRGIRLTARDLCLGGIVCAMTLVLATIRIPLPTGSNITCGSWIPLMLLALLYDYRLSMLSGWVCGILAMLLIPGWQAVHWAQIFVQQLVCFSCLGYAGVFGSDKRWKAICGMALAAKIDGEDSRVYAILGDGEIEEGQVWEAFMFAAHFKLDNLCVIIDINGLQIDGPTEKVMNSAPVDAKMEAFGFNVVTIDGHDFDQIESAFAAFRACTGKPTAILMHTTKGKGVSYMENSVDWHGKAPNDAEYEVAMGELRAAMAELEA